MMTRLLQWPLHSMRRLLLTAVALVAVIGAAALAVAMSGGDKQPAAAPGPSQTRPTEKGGPSTSPSPSPSAPASPDYAKAIDVTRQFVTAWSSHMKDPQDWYIATARYGTDKMARRLTTVDPQNVPASKVDGTLRLTDTGGVQTQVAVPTDGGMVSVTLLPGGKYGWQVDDIQPGAQKEE